MRKYHYVVFNHWEGKAYSDNEDGYYSICLKELLDDKDVTIVNHPVDQSNKLVRLLYALHNSERINSFIKLPFKGVWFHKYFKKPKTNKPFCFVILEPKINVKYFDYLRKHFKNCKIVMVYRDLLKIYYILNPSLENNGFFDLQLSYDDNESNKAGMIHFDEFESKIDIEPNSLFPSCDVFFAGKAKDRLDILLNICNKLSKAGLVCNFYITHASKEQRKDVKGVFYIDRDFSYREMLLRSVNAKCLLDINQKGAVGYTSRFLEAVLYNKKLITNNKKITETKFYNPKFISYIENVDDIDPSFVDDTIVDYKYQNEFSPTCLLDIIEKNLCDKA